jgi:hypothetical protein
MAGRRCTTAGFTTLSALAQRGRTRVQPPLLRLEITANPTIVPLFLLSKNTRRIQVVTHWQRFACQ